jgi:hypothetical protein
MAVSSSTLCDGQLPMLDRAAPMVIPERYISVLPSNFGRRVVQ